MPPVSTIKRLPKEIREAINEQLAQGYTLTEVTAYVREMGVNVSRSAIGRYNAHRVKMLEEIHKSKETMDLLLNSRTIRGEQDVISKNLAMLQKVLEMVATSSIMREKDSTNPQEIMQLAIAAEKLVKALKTGAELQALHDKTARECVDTTASAVSPSTIEVTFVQAPKKSK